MPLASAGPGRRADPGGPPAAIAGLVSTALGRLPVAAKARVTGSGQRNGGSVKANRGLTVCITVVQDAGRRRRPLGNLTHDRLLRTSAPAARQLTNAFLQGLYCSVACFKPSNGCRVLTMQNHAQEWTARGAPAARGLCGWPGLGEGGQFAGDAIGLGCAGPLEDLQCLP
jgi:hypothetical protein